MKGKRGNRLARVAIASAAGIGAVSYGLRAAPAVEGAIARLGFSGGAGAAAGTAASGSEGATARPAYLVSASSPAAVAQTIAAFRKDGTYTGKRQYAYYGFVRVQATVKNGTLTDVKVIEYPNDNGRSSRINRIALPYLIQEAMDAQSYRVDFISGATFTSDAFAKSLRDALGQAGT